MADLIESGHAYVAKNGDVYFRVKSDQDYGKLCHLNLEDLKSGNRELRHQMDDDLKEDPADFAVWKAAKPGEPYWDSPYGKGRPGWHIECSAMARTHLGNTTVSYTHLGTDVFSGVSPMVLFADHSLITDDFCYDAARCV